MNTQKDTTTVSVSPSSPFLCVRFILWNILTEDYQCAQQQFQAEVLVYNQSRKRRTTEKQNCTAGKYSGAKSR
jgi:hypothetical protein